MYGKSKKRRSPFRHLNQYDRDRLEALLRAGHKLVEVAGILGVSPSTVSWEVKGRQTQSGVYRATVAQAKALVKRSRSKYQGMKIEKDPALRVLVVAGLKAHRSPDEIAGRLRLRGWSLGKNSLYKWLYSIYGQAYCKYLCTRRYRRRKQRRSGPRLMIADRVPLMFRPFGLSFIHWEGDTALSLKRSGSKAAAVLMSETTSKLILGQKVKNLKPAGVAQAMQTALMSVRADTLSLDNGQENRAHRAVGVATYFCDAYAPWQKALVENSIGLLRRWFVPKKTNWHKVSEAQLQKYLHIINGKYRKSLNYLSAYEVALERGIIKKTNWPGSCN